MNTLGTSRAIFACLLAVASQSVAAVRVEVKGVDGPLRDNVLLHVGTPVREVPLVVRRHAEGAAAKARAALEALGYYESTIQVSASRDGETRVIRLDITPGQPVLVTSVSIVLDGEAGDDPDFLALLRQPPLREGEPLHHGRYEETKRALASLARRRGYFDARFTESAIQLHRSSRKAGIVLRFDSGRRYRFGPVRLPETPFSEKLLLRLVPFAEGDPYTTEKVTALHRNYLRSDYFEEVRILQRPEEADAEGRIPIDMELAPNPRNRVGFGVGAATDVGPRLRLDWTRPWMNSHGHSALIKNEVSWVRQDVSANYSIPLNPPLNHQLQFTGGWQREDIEDTDRETFRTGVQRKRLYDSGWQHNISLRWEQERYTQADVHDTTTLTIPAVSLGRTRRRGGTIPTSGDRLFAQLETAHPEAFSDIRLTRLLLQGKYLNSWRRHSLSGRVEYGALDTEDFDRTPPSLRFFAGGDQSVRGFAYQSLAPRNEEDDLVGGRYLLTGSLEYNLRFAGKWSAAVFFDIGNASGDSRFSEGFARGAGFGIRWYSPLAPLKLDAAWGISEPDPPFRIHFSMGLEL